MIRRDGADCKTRAVPEVKPLSSLAVVPQVFAKCSERVEFAASEQSPGASIPHLRRPSTFKNGRNSLAQHFAEVSHAPLQRVEWAPISAFE